ncbi:tripartite tricarboxylate transporter substrate binding protein [Aestuariivirga litoralis]|uniref:Tripartite tricarboxylate transporter substrate binding protein n=1 Tax=Aestuariivirga litoralis TaxID=2650924 RepID=A0A2W2AKL4_9HYPH|nr:tripartite tricarboxylate transporter substrate-binding protein [Aestuariivirga litoralis]PZF75881.1 tripartite tricarboxylate transporter substrate binding protein [Aestuariivirga litoralis]
MIRRTFSHALFALSLMAGASFLTGAAQAMDNLRIIAPAKPGGGWDQTARALAEVMAAGGAKGITVENVPGAGGTVGLAQLIDQEKGKPDVLMVNGLVMLGAILTNQSPVNLGMTTPIARLTGEYEVIVVPAASEVKTLADLAAKMKADAGSVAIGGGSAGGTDHILAGLVVKAAGGDVTKLNYVPFSGGGEALAAILGGHVVAGISGLSEWSGQIASGELRVLGISAPERQAGIDIPTLKEQGIDVELANWRAIVAAPGIDDAQKKALLDAVDQAVKSDAWKKVLADKKWTDLYLPGDQFAQLIEKENALTTEVLKSVGLVQ